MSEHPVLDCPDKEVAILMSYGGSRKLQNEMLETLSFKDEGLPAGADDYILRKIEVAHTMLRARGDYLVGLIWEIEQRRKGEE